MGFPLFQERIKKKDFDFLIDKLKVRLNGWKAKLLNRAGRVTLARSVLTTMPVYNMQFHNRFVMILIELSGILFGTKAKTGV